MEEYGRVRPPPKKERTDAIFLGNGGYFNNTFPQRERKELPSNRGSSAAE
jgi:hypothetical protein